MNLIYNLLFFVPLIFFFGCQKDPQEKTSRFSANVMTIDYHITIGQKLSLEQEQDVKKIIADTFAHINNTFNKWNPNSELSILNKLKANQKSDISPELENFLKETQKIVELSNGRFDPTIEPLQKLWKKYLAEGKTPNENEINAILPAIGWEKIHFNNGVFYKDNDLTSIDLGGIAKGLAVDWIVEELIANGFDNVYVEWGGEIRTHGQHPDNRPWTIFISNLGDEKPENAIEYIYLNNQAVATSGDYLQNWQIIENGKAITYFHIIDPKSGRPLMAHEKSIASATVVAPSCVLADGLATVAMMFSNVDEAAAWLEEVKKEYPTIEYWLVARE